LAVLDHPAAVQMKFIQKLFESAFMLIVAMFYISAVTLVIFSIGELWGAIRPAGEVAMQTRFVAILECISFLSRFIVVVVVALSIECLVAVFELIHEAPELLPHAATIGIAAAALLAAWGLFVRLNIAAETLEPQAMKTATDEDEKVHAANGTEEEVDPGAEPAAVKTGSR
jgi:hypothetical protein